MADHKATFDLAVREPLASLVEALSERLRESGSPLRGDPRRSLFRIHRDTRFSRDKRPFKTNVGATLTRDGEKLSPGLLYIHIEPARSFLAAGFHRPDPPTMSRLRLSLVEQPTSWRTARDGLARAGLGLEPGEALSRVPRGFDGVVDETDKDILKLKSWIVRTPLDEAECADPSLVERILRFSEDALPLLNHGWAVLDG